MLNNKHNLTQKEPRGTWIITIDGEAATGKSSCGQKLANELDFTLIDTGFYYRFLTWLGLKEQLTGPFTPQTSTQLLKLANNNYYYDFTKQQFYYHQKEITNELFTLTIANQIQHVSTNKDLRAYITKTVRAESVRQDTILVGRDAGSNIAKDAEVKFFLTVNEKEKIRRRRQQLKNTDQKVISAMLKQRDESDKTRQLDPLKPLPSSIILDTSDLTIKTVVNFMLNQIKLLLTTKLPQIILIGPSNVGKSTLFNRLTRGTTSLVSRQPFTTRDLVKQRIVINHHPALLIDSGGIEPKLNTPLHHLILERNLTSIKEGAVFLLVFDLNQICTEKEKWYFNLLKRFKKPVILVLNKVDQCQTRVQNQLSYQKLGIKEQLIISAKQKTNLWKLIQSLAKHLLANHKAWEEKLMRMELGPGIALFGQTNVGKSTLFNALIGKELAITSPFEHTTTNLIQFTIMLGKQHLNLIDTAGQRRKKQKRSLIEIVSNKQGENLLKMIDIAILVLDGSKPITDQDQRIAWKLRQHRLPILLIVNKSDLLQKWPRKETIYHHFPQLAKKNLLFTNSLNLTNRERIGSELLAIFKEKRRVYAVLTRRNKQKQLNHWLNEQNWNGKIYAFTYQNGVFNLAVDPNLYRQKNWQKHLEKQIVKTEKFQRIKPVFIYKNQKNIVECEDRGKKGDKRYEKKQIYRVVSKKSWH